MNVTYDQVGTMRAQEHGHQPILFEPVTVSPTLFEPMIFEPRSQDGHARVSSDGLCPTINTAQGGQRQPCVAFVKAKRAQSDTDDDRWEESAVAPTQNAFDVGDTRATTVVAFSHTQDPDAVEDKSPCMGHEALAVMTYQKVTGCYTQGAHPGSYNGQDAYNDMLVITPTVRRLTPTECERLQGYPDGWTDIPGASDSARYKSLGNSFAIPCAFFVISGCVEHLRKENT